MKKILAILLILIGLFLNFYRFWAWGTEGTDEIMYQKIALEWLNGNLVLNYPSDNILFFRPVLYAMLASSFYVFGVNAWALKFMNLLIMIVVTLITYLTSKRLGLRSVFVILPSLLILFHPHIMGHSKKELAHLPSLLFISAGLYLFILALEKKKTLYFILFAICMHCATTTHPDLALLLPGFILVFFIDCFFENQFSKADFIKFTSVILLTYFAPVLIYFVKWPPLEIYSMIENIRTYQVPVAANYPFMLLSQFLSYGMTCLLGHPFTLFFYFSILVTAFFAHQSNETFKYKRLLLIPVIVYFVLFPILIVRNNIDRILRLLIPLLPFLTIYVSLELQRYYKLKPRLIIVYGMLSILLTPIIMSYQRPLFHRNVFEFYKFNSDFSAFGFKTKNQVFFENHKSEISNERKLLLAPSYINQHRTTWALSLPFYFGDNLVSLNTCSPEKQTFEEFIELNKIKYVLIYKSHDPWAAQTGFNSQFEKLSETESHPCLVSRSEYLRKDPNLEIHRMKNFLVGRGARKVESVLGDLYEL